MELLPLLLGDRAGQRERRAIEVAELARADRHVVKTRRALLGREEVEILALQLMRLERALVVAHLPVRACHEVA